MIESHLSDNKPRDLFIPVLDDIPTISPDRKKKVRLEFRRGTNTVSSSKEDEDATKFKELKLPQDSGEGTITGNVGTF